MTNPQQTEGLTSEQIAEGRDAFDHITHNMIQLDEDGINVSVSRQALEQVLTVAARICYPEAYPTAEKPVGYLIRSRLPDREWTAYTDQNDIDTLRRHGAEMVRFYLHPPLPSQSSLIKVLTEALEFSRAMLRACRSDLHEAGITEPNPKIEEAIQECAAALALAKEAN